MKLNLSCAAFIIVQPCGRIKLCTSKYELADGKHVTCTGGVLSGVRLPRCPRGE
jgi:hypothetical protein